MSRLTLRTRAAAAATAVLGALLVVASPAAAAGACGQPTLEQVFKAQGDLAWYVPAPNGGFADGTSGWTLTGAARVDPDEPRQALALPAGSSATSAPMCIDLDYPTMRFWASNRSSGDSRLAVSVRFRLRDGEWRTLKVAELDAGEAWSPTRVVRVLANYLAYYPQWDHQVAFRFAPTGDTADWRIDDVWVDPYAR